VAGGGFAGLTLATALATRGWSARVHERGPIPRGVGAGIFLWENGLAVMSALGAHAHLRGRTHQALQWEDRDADGRLLSARPLPLPGGLRMVTLTRRDLHSALIARSRAAGVEIRAQSQVTGADPAGALITADGSRWPADLVVGADGIHSAVRRDLGLPTRHRRFEEFLIYRFLVALSRAPGAEGQWRNYVDHWDFKRRRRVLYVPCNDEDLYLMLSARSADLAATATPLDGETWRASFPLLSGLLESLPGDLRQDNYEAVDVKRWSAGRAAIVGDAAHAMPPTLGQGAGTAMMNALNLALAVQRADDVQAALLSWEAAERPATEATQKASVERVKQLFRSAARGRSEWTAPDLEAARRTPGAVPGSAEAAEGLS